MEEGKFERRKVSPGIDKKLIFFEGKCNWQGNKLGTAKYTLVWSHSGDSTAERQQEDRKVKFDGSSEGMTTWKSESVRVDECYE
jgi:hypothetical protein